MTPHPMSYQKRALFVWMLMGSIWTMLSTLAQYFSCLCKSDLSKSWEFAWRRRGTNFSPAFSLCPWTETSCLLLLSLTTTWFFALYSPFICPIIDHLVSFSVLALVFLSLFYFSSVSFVNLLLILWCHLSLSCPCLQLLLSATTFWLSSISNTFLWSLLLAGYPLIFIYQSLQFFATLGREDASVHT